jgi:hypothetical protein
MKAAFITFLEHLMAAFPVLEQGLVVEKAGEQVLELWPQQQLRSILPVGIGKARYAYIRLAKPIRFEVDRPLVACGTPVQLVVPLRLVVLYQGGDPFALEAALTRWLVCTSFDDFQVSLQRVNWNRYEILREELPKAHPNSSWDTYAVVAYDLEMAVVRPCDDCEPEPLCSPCGLTIP